jgi:hypothetical protein
MKTHFLISAAFCFAISAGSDAAAEGSFLLAQGQQTTTAPNALDAEDRIRARELEQDRAEVRRRLGDRSPEPTIRDEGFTAPTTNASPKSNDRPKSNQNQKP